MGTALHDAEAHLAKAREFLTAAESAASQDLHNAATSNAVVSGINSKDAICLRLKTKAQYQTLPVARKDVENAVRWAGNLYDGAHGIVNS